MFVKLFLPAIIVFLMIFLMGNPAEAQSITELNSEWKCININKINADGKDISLISFETDDWLPATVPGTVLTTLLNNGLVPDPNYAMNNEMIPDIYDKGIDYYTYWFVKDFETGSPARNEEVWLHFRGVNYSCDIYLNGQKLNKTLHRGMFLRQSYNITPYLSRNGKNRLAVIVFPPDPPGNPNGGQGGDGTIGRNVSHQYVAGWDWIQPVRDRNTGIWDKVYIERTGEVNIKNPHIITLVPGIRFPQSEHQDPAIVKVSVQLENPTGNDVRGTLSYKLTGQTIKSAVTVPAHETIMVQLPDYTLVDPALWWPNGYGPQNLYDINVEFRIGNNSITDRVPVRFGIRELKTEWNPLTRSMEFLVNGQKVFIKGGNWIISDAMLRFSPERYDAEVRFHRDMNLNLIRIWGGAITERPEFYNACDKYGILVWQDFWISGDCNGRWQDRRKKDNQWGRRKYPDDHNLFIRSVVDQVKMIRNHPSLLIWSGGNEMGPPEDIVRVMNDTLASELDGTRVFIESSTSGELYYNIKGGTGDGPYGIQEIKTFWEERSFPFNPELGSIGTGDYQSLKRFISDSSMIIPGRYHPEIEETNPWRARWAHTEPAWRYHKYLGYGNFIDKYGGADNVQDFVKIAQLINYNQYRAMVEGFSSHMWEWYTGFIIWKTQNPWTALRGQMYDWYLDPNGGLYGLHNGSAPLHVMYNPVDGMIMIANNTYRYYRNVMVVVKTYDETGKALPVYQQLADIDPATVMNCQVVRRGIDDRSAEKGIFLSLKLMASKDKVISENLYWLPDSTGNYTMLQNMPQANIRANALKSEEGKLIVNLSNGADNPIAFFMRLSLVNARTHERLLPVFYSDNYISIEPDEEKNIEIEFPENINLDESNVRIEGWNVKNRYIKIE